MNLLLIPTILGTAVFFLFGIWLSGKVRLRRQAVLLALVGILAAIPAIFFVVYYTGVLGEAGWFYSFRAIPGTEISACGIGLLAGCFQKLRSNSHIIRRQMSVAFIPFITLLCVMFPYLKQIFLRPDWNNFNDRWSEGVCLQSSESSCGPASAATLLKLLGKPVSEKQIAQESFTSRRGTENWYLIRTLKRHGVEAKYVLSDANNIDFTFPSIAGVRLGGKTGAGHFIAVLNKTENGFVIGDPLSGREELSTTQLLERYYFTGFAIAFNKP